MVMGPWIEHLPCKCEALSLRSQNPQRASAVVRVYNPVDPVGKWEAETRGTLEAHGPASLLYTVEMTVMSQKR